jgi:tetratricopeptide (TPR) repeat protein
MDQPFVDPHDLSPRQAQAHLARANELKAAGSLDAALTEYRRAALADPKLFAAHMEIAAICKEKAKRDPVFLRHAFEAYRAAARLDLTHQEAHDQYIVAGQRLGHLEQLHEEYKILAKAHPENAFLQRCNQNIVTLTLAMMPDRVNVSDGGFGKRMRKALFFVSIGLVVAAASVIIGPFFLKKTGRAHIEPAAMKRFLTLGVVLGFAGLGGFVVFSRLRDR